MAGVGRRAAMSTGAEQPDQPVALRFERRDYDDPLVQELVAQLQDEFVVRYGGPDRAAVDPEDFRPPTGQFLVGFELADRPVAAGGYRRLHDATAELKRMYVPAGHRGKGYGRAMLAALEAAARAAGVRRLVLNTGVQQPEAIALYESAGWRSVAAFGHYAATPGALFYGRSLSVPD